MNSVYKSDGTISLRQNWIVRSVHVLVTIATQKSFVALADQIIVSATNFLTGVIIGRACVKEEFGLYMLVFTIVIFMMHWQHSLILVPYTFFSQRLKGKLNAQYTGSSLIQQLALSIFFFLALLISGLISFSGFGPVGLIHVMRTLAFFIIFILLREYIRNICFATMSMKTAFVIDCCVAFFQIGGLLLLVRFGMLSAQNTYCVVGIVCGITALTWLILNRQKFTLKDSHFFSIFWQNWTLAKFLLGSQTASVSSVEIFPWFITIFHGIGATAVFTACRLIVNIVNPVLLGAQNYLIPATNQAFVKGDIKEMNRIVIKYSIYIALIGGSISIIIISFSELLLGVVYENRYAGSGNVMSFLILSSFVRLMAIPFSTGLIAMEKATKDFMSNTLGLLVVCTFGLWITRLYGANGAAIGLLGSSVLSTIAKYIYYKRKLQLYLK